MKVWNTRQVKFANFEPVLYANSHLAKIMGGSVHQPSLCQIGTIFVIHNYRAKSAESTPECVWEFIPLAPVTPPPLLESLQNLSSAMPKDTRDKKSLFQHTLQSLSDFTGYISAQVYVPYRPTPIGKGLPNSGSQGTLEEELRREIRALKGLVLNRCAFYYRCHFR
jgi:hypothetical protein